jgi:hypothetical protein
MDKEFAEAFKEEIEEASKLPPHLAKFFDKDGNSQKHSKKKLKKKQVLTETGQEMMKRRKRNTLLSEEKRKVVTVSLDTLKVKKWIENSQKHSKKKLKKEK